jgi:hypothetical protein
MDMGAKDEFIGEKDDGGTRFTFRMSWFLLACVFRDTFIDDTPMGPTARVPPHPFSLLLPVQLR